MKYLRLYEKKLITLAELILEKYPNSSEINCTGMEFSEIGDLHEFVNVQRLVLKFCNLQMNLRSLSELKNLTELCLWDDELKSLEWLTGLNFPNLRRLFVGGNEITSLKGIESLLSIEELGISRNSLKSLDGIQLLPNLDYIDCSHNMIKDMSVLIGLGIKHFWCIENPLEKPLPRRVADKIENNPSIIYGSELIKKFSSLEYQTKFFEEHPEDIGDLKPIGIHPELAEISEFFGENMKYLKKYEAYDSGIVRVESEKGAMIFSLRIFDSEAGVKVRLLLDGESYCDLSIKIPDSEKLGGNEFFLNPKVDKNIVRELEEQGFITKTGIIGDAAGQNVSSYSLGI